jgi:hypothetical protein
MPDFITIPLGCLTEDSDYRVKVAMSIPEMAQYNKNKTAISLPELVKQTNAFSVKNRPGCVATLLNSDPKQLLLHYNVKCKEKTSNPLGHDVKVKFDVTKVEQTQKAADLDVQVSCGCEACLFWGGQWNLGQRGGLLGEPRPKYQAPTKQLDLRANFVICKHVKAVFERILPSVQHNIVKILRERTILKNKEKENTRQVPDKLQKKWDEMRERQEKNKGKGKGTQKKLLDAIRQREDEKLKEEKALEDTSVVERSDSPAVPVIDTPKLEELPENIPVMPGDMKSEQGDTEDLLAEEENRLHKEQEKEHEKIKNKPHLHEGLPYEVEDEKTEHHHKVPTDRELMDILKKKQEKPNDMKQFTDNKYKRRRSSLEDTLLASLAEEEEDVSTD